MMLSHGTNCRGFFFLILLLESGKGMHLLLVHYILIMYCKILWTKSRKIDSLTDKLKPEDIRQKPSQVQIMLTTLQCLQMTLHYLWGDLLLFVGDLTLFANDLALFADRIAQRESLSHSLYKAARGIRFYINLDKIKLVF